MWDIERNVTHIEAMLARSEISKNAKGTGRFAKGEIDSIKRVVNVVKLLGKLLDEMDRPIPPDDY